MEEGAAKTHGDSEKTIGNLVNKKYLIECMAVKEQLTLGRKIHSAYWSEWGQERKLQASGISQSTSRKTPENFKGEIGTFEGQHLEVEAYHHRQEEKFLRSQGEVIAENGWR